MSEAASGNESDISQLLEDWATATRIGRKEAILTRHLPDVLIYDVLAPLKYDSAKDYRASWDEWQPQTDGEGIFQLEDLSVTSGDDVAFAHALLRCGGTLPSGQVFEDLVRATFCLVKRHGEWLVAHQHISKPINVKE